MKRISKKILYREHSPFNKVTDYVILNTEEKWFIPRGSENIKEEREMFTKITQDYYYAEWNIDNEKAEKSLREKAIQEGMESTSEIWFYQKIDRYSLERR